MPDTYFDYAHQPKIPSSEEISVLVFSKQTLLCDAHNKCIFSPRELRAKRLEIPVASLLYLGKYGSQEWYAAHIDQPQGLSFVNVHSLLDGLHVALHTPILRALQLLHWQRVSRYCGCCGRETHLSDREFVKICQGCGQQFFPQYSVAVIMRVTRGDEILLGRGPHFPEKMYSTLAGFVEAGESCEHAVMRETREEVGIDVHNIRYHSMQPWPFPNSLMIAYTAEYKSGTLAVNRAELEDAQWFHVEKLPQLPIKTSVAHTMIQEFVAAHRASPTRRTFCTHIVPPVTHFLTVSPLSFKRVLSPLLFASIVVYTCAKSSPIAGVSSRVLDTSEPCMGGISP